MASSVAETPWKTLEPASLVVNLVPDLWRTFRNAWPLLLAVVVGGTMRGVVDLALLFVFLGLSGARTVLHFATLRYRLAGGKLEIKSGLLGRQSRVIDPSRIQNVAIVQNLFHRATGLVELRVETAGDAGAEGLLSAISVREAEALRAALARAHPAEADAAPSDEVIASLGWLELIGFGISAGRAGTAILGALFASSLFGDVQPAGELDAFLDRFSKVQLVGLAIAGLALSYVVSVGSAVVRHHGFRLTRSARGFAAESGLFTRRRVEIPLRKVQVLRVDEPWMRRWMGFATLQIETAGSPLPGQQQASEAVVPMVDRDDLDALADQVLPGSRVSGELRPAARRALWRALRGATLGSLPLAGAAAWFGWWWVGLLAWAWLALNAWLDWRGQGWRVDERFVVVRRGVFTRRTYVVPIHKVQSVHLGQGPVRRRYRLAQVVVWVAGTRVGLPDIDEPDARAVFDALAARAATSSLPAHPQPEGPREAEPEGRGDPA